MVIGSATEIQEDVEQAGRPAGPCVMVVFGATGDLTMRKLVPALYNLEKAHLLPEQFAVLGVAHDDMSLEDFRKKVSRFLQTEDHGTEIWDHFQQSLRFLQGDFGDEKTFARLRETLAQIDAECATDQNYLFYLATSPKFFCEVVQQLGRSGLSKEENGHWRRVDIEKPFGQDLESAFTLNQQIKEVLPEKHIFRNDQHPTKNNILTLHDALPIYTSGAPVSGG